MSIIILPTCPTTCAGTLGAVDFDDCAPEVHYGEIAKLYLWVLGEAPFATQAEFDSAAHWATHISDSGATSGAIREFIIMGELPEPEQTEVAISGDRTVTGFKKFVMNFEIDETNETNYNFLLLSECGGKYKACFETADGIIYGGYNGLEVSLKMNQPIPKGRQEVVKITGKMTWQSKNHPLRQISILA
jgi:hypothetical protein